MQHAIFTLFAILAVAAPGAAQQLTLEIRDGRVNLEATSVPVRQILAEWAKVGGTRVINGERVAGAPLTLTLVDVPEKQAIEIVLRNVAGYLAAPRSATAAPGASLYDRIMVLPTSAAPAASAASARPAPAPARPGQDPRAGLQRFVPPRPAVLTAPGAENEDEEVETLETEEPVSDEPGTPPVFSFPTPGQAAPGGVTTSGPVPFGQPAPPPATVPPGYPQTTNPATGSSVPGVIMNPQPTTPGATPGGVRPPRPPGSDD